jgi:muramoyltetrapeptide carboxypeptidase
LSHDHHDHDHHHPHGAAPATLTLFSPSGVVAQAAVARRAARRLKAHGFDVRLDEAALARHQRFAGDDDTRLAALHRVAASGTDIAMALRGGYGLTRLLDRIDYRLVQRSIEGGTRWVGHSDFTTLQLALLARGGGVTYAGPMGCFDFGGEAVDDITEACFLEAMHGELEAVGFRTEPGFDGLDVKGLLWGGNLCMVNALLGTPYWPRVRGGILFLEDVNEHPYRIERDLLQLHQAGVLDAQKAIVLGEFTGWTKSPLDRGYNLKAAVAQVRSLTRTPVLTGLPFGHVATKVTLPVGMRAQLVVDGRDALIAW